MFVSCHEPQSSSAPESESSVAKLADSAEENPCQSGTGFLVRLLISCGLEAVHRVSAAVRDTLTAHRATEGNIGACELAVVEGCNNAILYAKGPGNQKPVEIQLL